MDEELQIKYYPVPVYWFVGRETELQGTKETLEQDNVVAIVGMGGIGKTQLAGRYAMVNKHYYDFIYYFHAEIQEQLIFSIHQLAAQFRIAIKENGESIEVNQILYNLYKIFDKKHALFIFDDVVDKELIQSLLPSAVGLSNSKIHIILTSRRSEWQNIAITRLHLTTFNQQTALQMFEKILGPKYDKENEDDWNELSKILGYLPLALQVSTFHIRKQKKYLPSFTITKYIDIIKEEINSGGDILYQDYNEIIYNSVKISLNMLEKETDSDLAIKLVNVLAHVEPTGIEEERLSAFVEGESWTGNLDLALFRMLDHTIILKQKDEKLHMHEIIQQCIKFDQKHNSRFEYYRALANTLHNTKPFIIKYNQTLELPSNNPLQQELNLDEEFEDKYINEEHQSMNQNIQKPDYFGTNCYQNTSIAFLVPIYSNPNYINQTIYNSNKPIVKNKKTIDRNLLLDSGSYYNDTELLNEESPVNINYFIQNFINAHTHNLPMIKS